ncbi:MucBP domain-containing protein, partial [Leucobacter chinensis]|uniref:MucBP domain-containing protein n=1 Tax=Leucobacter chinensis TaxID=2851010 RepID=UPI001C24DA51
YTFVQVDGPATGTFTTEPQTVTYVYRQNTTPAEKGTVTVAYVDTDGTPLTDPETLTGTIGDTYETEQRTFDGYTFVQVDGPATGTFTTEPQTVTYVYKATQGPGPGPGPDPDPDPKPGPTPKPGPGEIVVTGAAPFVPWLITAAGALIAGALMLSLTRRRRSRR